jgi:hypothetical protein
MADLSGDMGGVELIQNNNSNDDINDTGGDDDVEKRLVKAKVDADHIDVTTEKIIKLIEKSLTSKYSIDLEKFNVNHLILHKRRIRIDLL